MRVPPADQRLIALEAEFDSLLVPFLKECAKGRWGLFGQNQNPDVARFLQWKEAERLKELAEEITSVRAVFGQPNLKCERFLQCCEERGENLPGEPKRAKKFLKTLGIDW